MTLIKTQTDIAPSEITDEALFNNRRQFLRSVAASLISTTLPTNLLAEDNCNLALPPNQESLSSLQSITHYNNYYEFSTNKRVIFELAKALTLRPWSLTIEGEVENPLTIDIEDLLSDYTQEERIYACVVSRGGEW